VTIRFLGGPRSGEVLTFGDDRERIAVGRDAEQCDVTFAPTETRVGREHCALIRKLGRYRLVLNQDNPVLIDGQRAMDGQELAQRAELQFGIDGPRALVETGYDRALPSTEFQGKQEGQATLVRKASGTAAAGRRMAIAAVVLLAVASVVGYQLWKRSDVAVAQTKSELDSTKTDLASTKSDVTETKSQLEETKQRVERIEPTVTALTQLTDEQKKILKDVTSEVAQADKRIKELEPRLVDALTKASPSVYLVLLKAGDGRETSMATAWVVDQKKGLLATNSHVAELINEVEAGGKLLVRSNASSPKTFEVESVSIHPGYREFAELWYTFDPMQRRSATSAEKINPPGPGCDVGLLTVANPEGLAEALPLAPQEVLESLSPGYAIGYVGYPMEGLVLGGVNPASPTPVRHMAYVSSLTSYFGDSNAPIVDRTLIQHALPAAGGASGSPILNRDGQVVGVLSGGNVIGSTGSARIASSVNIFFGQRVDLVKELLEGTAQEQQKVRTATWLKDIARYFEPRAEVQKSLLAARERIIANTIHEWQQTQDGLGNYTVATEEVATKELYASPRAEVEVDNAKAGSCLAMAYAASTESPIKLEISEQADGNVRTWSAPESNVRWAQAIVFDSKANSKVKTIVESPYEASTVMLKMLRAARTRVPDEQRLADLQGFWRLELILRTTKAFNIDVASKTSGTLPDALSEAEPAVAKIDLTLKEAIEYFAFVSTPGDEEIGISVALDNPTGLVQLASYRRNLPTAYTPFVVPADSKVSIFVQGAKSGLTYNFQLLQAVETK
jgi:S1-C subfamily serine protease